MRYKPGEPIPQEKRREINEKILWLIETGQCERYGISREDVFQAYTGDGGLHGLERKDFASYHLYAEAKREVEIGQFFTPPLVCKFVVDCIRPSETDLVADLTAGRGDFLNPLPALHNAYGNEVDPKAVRVMRYLFPEARITLGDIRFYEPGVLFDVVFGNPPFNLRWKVDGNEYLSQLYYCLKAHELLKPGGLLALIVPGSFLADDFTDRGMIEAINKLYRFVYQGALPANTFAAMGVDHYPTKLMIFQKRSRHLPDDRRYTAHEPEPVTPSEAAAERIYRTYVEPLLREREAVRTKLYLEVNQRLAGDREFHDRVKKLLFDIRRHPRLKARYAECQEILHRFNTQEKPETMSWQEWEQVRLTEDKVLTFLKDVLRSQHERPPRPGERVVKTQYGLRLDVNGKPVAYHPFYELVQSDEYPFADRTYAKLVRRKRREYLRQERPFSSMPPDPEIGRFLDELVIHDSEGEREIRLRPRQKADANLLLQKRYHAVQWEQGSGKSVEATAELLYRLQHGHVRQVFITGPAIAVRNNWATILPSYGIPSRLIESLADLDAVRPGEVVLITLDMLVKYQRQVKRLVKKRKRRVLVILDEADAIATSTSKRTKAVLNCFRRAAYKTLLTGTMTRNNVAEAFTQLELLYNNSANMLSECRTIFRRSKDDPDRLEEMPNPFFGQPIPPYLRGRDLFRASHVPGRVTVFGVEKLDQDIYNADALKRLLDKTVITRSFEEVTGRKPFIPVQHEVRFNAAERALYDKIVNDFFTFKGYFTSTGNLRKDRMLEIIQQLILMLRACTVPHLFAEYAGGQPSKVKAILSLLQQWADERVAIGLRHVDAVEAYAEAIRARFPNRPVFAVTGNAYTLAQRRRLVEELRGTTNGVLVCTQQSLACSMNIGFIDRVIVAELHWNDPAMSQWYFRFIRLDSKSPDKEVHFVVTRGTIESNLLAMILAKQRINLFMKGQEVDSEELLDRYGIDYDLLASLMFKEKSHDGKVQIRWGFQEIA